MAEHIYRVDLSWKKDRLGELSSPELNQSLEVATPPQFPNGIDGIWSPEHLMTAAVSSCLMTTFLAIAQKSRLEFTDFNCSASGRLDVIHGRYLLTQINLVARLKIVKERDKERAEKILHRSEELCLISNSIKTKVVLETEVTL